MKWQPRRWLKMAHKQRKYFALLRLNQPEDLVLLLLPALWSSWLATSGTPNWVALLLLLFAAATVRSAAWVFNDLMEAKLLKHAPESMVAQGTISKKVARDIFTGLCVTAALATALLGRQALLYAPAALLLLIGYPYLKRKSILIQAYMGFGVAWIVPMAYVAQGSAPEKVTWLLFTAVLLWASAYFTLFSVPKFGYEQKVGIRSLIQLFGNAYKSIIALLQLLALVALLLAGRQSELGPFFITGLIAASGLVVYQQILLDRLTLQAGAMAAYRMNIWLGIAIFCGILFHFFCLCNTSQPGNG
jgi:4-hydroxybenzoate polyprenyltransferase